MISAERNRQIKEEGWTAEHDKKHIPGVLALAGAIYALDVAGRADKVPENIREDIINICQVYWPFGKKGWKPTAPGDPVRQLVKAGALIAAEIDRILSLQGK